jgi:hypothetical protein
MRHDHLGTGGSAASLILGGYHAQCGHHGDDGDQGDEHVQQVRVQAVGLKALRDRHHRREEPERGPVQVSLDHLHDIGGVPEMGARIRAHVGTIRGAGAIFAAVLLS